MNTGIIRLPVRDELPAVIGVDPYGAFLADARSPRTRDAREQDLKALARYLRVPSGAEAVRIFVGGTAGQANGLVIGWISHQRELGRAAATINRRLSSLRKLCDICQRLEIIDWTVRADSLPSQPYRDTSGPGRLGMDALIEHAKAKAISPKGKRDWALIALLYSEACPAPKPRRSTWPTSTLGIERSGSCPRGRRSPDGWRCLRARGGSPPGSA